MIVLKALDGVEEVCETSGGLYVLFPHYHFYVREIGRGSGEGEGIGVLGGHEEESRIWALMCLGT